MALALTRAFDRYVGRGGGDGTKNSWGFHYKHTVDKMIIAYSRPPNIKDVLTKAKLHQAPGKEASKYYSGRSYAMPSQKFAFLLSIILFVLSS